MGWIYLLQVYPDNPEKIYKFGMTKRPFIERYKEYLADKVKPSIIIVAACPDCDTSEKTILKIFNEKFHKLATFGKEYFTGNVNMMQQIIWQHLAKPTITKEINNYWCNFYLNISREPAFAAWIYTVFNGGSEYVLYLYDPNNHTYYQIFLDYLIKCGVSLNIVYEYPKKIEKNTVVISKRCDFYEKTIYIEILDYQPANLHQFYSEAYQNMQPGWQHGLTTGFIGINTNLGQKLQDRAKNSLSRWLPTLTENLTIMAAYEKYFYFCQNHNLFSLSYDKFQIWMDRLFIKTGELYLYNTLKEYKPDVNINIFINEKITNKQNSRILKKALHTEFCNYMQKDIGYITFCKIMNEYLTVEKIKGKEYYTNISVLNYVEMSKMEYQNYLDELIEYKACRLISADCDLFKKEIYLDYMAYCRENQLENIEESIFMDFLQNEFTGTKNKIHGYKIIPVSFQLDITSSENTQKDSMEIETTSQISSISISKKTQLHAANFDRFRAAHLVAETVLTTKRDVYLTYKKFCEINNLVDATDKLLFKYLKTFYADGKKNAGKATIQAKLIKID